MTGATLEGGRASYGLVLLGRPGALPKLLGARLVLQAAATLFASSEADRPTRRALHEVGAGVDALHAASMVGLALCSSRRRHEASRQALTATAFAAGGALVAHSLR